MLCMYKVNITEGQKTDASVCSALAYKCIVEESFIGKLEQRATVLKNLNCPSHTERKNTSSENLYEGVSSEY